MHILSVLITNNHVLNEEYFEMEDKIKIEINKKSIIIPINDNRKIWTNINFDYTIIEIKNSDKINDFLIIDENIINKEFSNIKYKNANIILPAFMKNGEIEYDKGIIVSIPKNSYYFLHDCNTDPGSSGGPIILIDNFHIIGIHKGYYKPVEKNIGIFLNYIINNIKKEKYLIKSKKEEIPKKHKNKIVEIYENLISKNDKEIIKNQEEFSIFKIYKNSIELGIGFPCIIPYQDKFNLIPVLFIYSESLTKKEIIMEEFILKIKNHSKKLLKDIMRKVFIYKDNIIIIEIKKNEDMKLINV